LWKAWTPGAGDGGQAGALIEKESSITAEGVHLYSLPLKNL
jgi:hypothetical protein